MNKKGITIPILITLIISIGLLFTGIYTYFSGVNTKSNEEKYNEQVNLIIESAKLWVKQNKVKGDITISLCELEKNDFIGSLINPLTDKEIPNDSKIVYENGNYNFILGKYNLKVCSSDNIYVELDKNDNTILSIPNEYDDVKEILIRENGEEVKQLYRNKKTIYELIYRFDNDIKTKYLIVRDTTGPNIDVDLKNYNYDESTNTIVINKNANFIIPEAIISDNSNSLIKTNEKNNIDIYNVGNYHILYEAVDEDDNKTIKEILVVVKSNMENENYYIDTNEYTNKKEIELKIKGIDTKEICISNNSICDNWIPYKENISWILDNNDKIYVYYKTSNDRIYMKTKNIYLDNENPLFVSSKKVLYGINYNLLDIINANDKSGIKTITNNNITSYNPNKLGINNLDIEIVDNAGNKTSTNISITTYKNLKCDNSVSSIINEDGLIKDGNDCIYAGSNPNNYIKINDDLYRIVSIDSSNKIKVVKNDSISKEEYNGSWYSSSLKDYLNNYYNNIKSNILTNGVFYYGDIYNQSSLNNIYYDNNRMSEVSFVAILSINDYLKAGLCASSTTWDRLLNNNPCKDNNWLNSGEYWLINSTSSRPLYVTNDGNISYTYGGKKDIKPVLYLKSGLGVISGDGTKSNPYIIDDTIDVNNLVCSLDTTNGFETSKLLTINTLANVKYSFDGNSFTDNNRLEVSKDGIITAYIKKDDVYSSCSIRLYKEYEYRYKECSDSNKVYGKWYAIGTSRESSSFRATSKAVAEMNNSNHYEVIDSTPCDNCKWVTKYERSVSSCKSFDDSVWSSWSNVKPEESVSRIIDVPRIKYGTR